MKHYINTTEVTPRNLEDIGIMVDFSKDVQQEAINIDTLQLPMIGREAVMAHLQSIGLSEGIPYFVEFNGKKMPYYIDLTEGLKVRSNEVDVMIKQRYAHDNFIENADSLTFEYLNTQVTLPFNEIGYKIVPQDALIRGLMVSLTYFVVSRAIADQLREVSKTAKEFTATVSYAPFAIQGKALEAGLQLAIQISYLAILIYQAKRLADQLRDLIYPKTRYFKITYVRDLIEYGCNHLGYTLKSTLLQKDYERLAIVPTPQNRQKKKFLDYLENELDFAFTTGYPTVMDTTPTLGSLIQAVQTMFNAKIKVHNKVVEIERWDYWKNNTSSVLKTGLVLQDKALDEFQIDTSKHFKRYLIRYLTDASDISTYDNYEVNTAEYSNEVENSVNKDLNLLKGITDASIPFARAKRKDELTWLDKQFKGLFKLIDKIAGTNYANSKDPRGYMVINQQFYGVSKIIMHDGNKKLAETDKINPHYLWTNYHSINQPNLYQFIIREKVPLPMTEGEFLTILDNNYANINGKSCEILNIEYLPMQNKALITFKEPTNVFKNNSKVIKIY